MIKLFKARPARTSRATKSRSEIKQLKRFHKDALNLLTSMEAFRDDYCGRATFTEQCPIRGMSKFHTVKECEFYMHDCAGNNYCILKLATEMIQEIEKDSYDALQEI